MEVESNADIARESKPPRSIAPDPAELSRQLEDLEVSELLGQGGMGFVYKAKQHQLDRVVALKILHTELQDQTAFAKRFEREAKALARLNHPNIVSIYDSGRTSEGRYYFVMEYVDGVNLREVLAGGHLQPEKALQAVPQICEALQYAHEEGVVHRDIKPENIMLDARGAVKIADFGLAKLRDPIAPDEALSGVDQRMGTAHYMAPEQVEDARLVDHRADIYSLGVVFYEMLTGDLPIGHFSPPSKKVELDIRLDKVVLKTLENRPDQRYQHAGELKTEIEFISKAPIRRSGFRSESSIKVMGLPLWAIAFGADLEAGEVRGHAKGIIAIGELATGIIAIGRIAVGLIPLGIISIGIFPAGVIAVGGITIGVIASGIDSYGVVSFSITNGLEILEWNP